MIISYYNMNYYSYLDKKYFFFGNSISFALVQCDISAKNIKQTIIFIFDYWISRNNLISRNFLLCILWLNQKTIWQKTTKPLHLLSPISFNSSINWQWVIPLTHIYYIILTSVSMTLFRVCFRKLNTSNFSVI